MEIEQLKNIPDGGFSQLPEERQAALFGWYAVHVNPEGKRSTSKRKPTGRGREVGRKRKGRR